MEELTLVKLANLLSATELEAAHDLGHILVRGTSGIG
jgi:hypothetical protein